jgi:hypothetical protein
MEPNRKKRILDEELEFHRRVMALVRDRLERDLVRIESPEKRAELRALLDATPRERSAHFRRLLGGAS